jgi:AraC family transcriptional regulator, regulatory protein of adaptative response / methylated-DNA-[protein]-cysteine methyltransferase
MELTFEEKYYAILRKDSNFEGVFITAVKTTGIFCRPACTARKPKPENVVFYDTPQEALRHGYRPCQVCKPLLQSETAPAHIQQLLDVLHRNPQQKINDTHLKKNGLEPHTVRRWFQKHYSMSFHAYQRMLRINSAYGKLTFGESVTAAAFDSGYDSLSGFNDSFQSIFGESPSHAKNKTVINIARVTTPLGPMYACATDKGICLLEFTDRKMLETEFNDLKKHLQAVILPGENAHLTQLQTELKEYFEGKRKVFSVALHTPGSEFQMLVWEGLQQIPYGETRSYKSQSIHLGKASAIRAVASANGHNRVSIIIPCHRVIGENGQLTGYGGGLARKQWLLNFEKTNL